MIEESRRDPHIEEVWRTYLTTGSLPHGEQLPWYETRAMRRIARILPSDPRCKICYYPFSGLGGTLARSILRLEPSKMNPHLCNVCERFANEHPGGAEIETSLLFADIRGSTPLAAKMNAYDFGQLINRFYRVTTSIIFEHGGLVEKLVGDEVTAFFVPAFSKEHNYALAAIEAGRAILAATGHNEGEEPWLPLGVGVHTGAAYIGAVGEQGKNVDIAVLGDNVNIAARLTGQAKDGEMVASDATYHRAGLDTAGLEFHSFDLKGKEGLVDAWIFRAGGASRQMMP